MRLRNLVSVINSKFGLALFLRYGNLLAENSVFFLPLRGFIRRPRSLCSFWNFAVKLTLMRTLESWGVRDPTFNRVFETSTDPRL